MTSAEFLSQLNRELTSLSPEERANALVYYREYLEDAGEDAASAIESLGSPQSVAERIIREVGTGKSPYGASKTYQQSAYQTMYTDENAAAPAPEKQKGDRVGLTVLVMILTFPLWITVFAIWISILATLVALVAALAFAAVAAPIQGASLLADGLGGIGIYQIGTGIFSLGLVLLLWKPCLLACKWLTIGLFKGSKAIVRGLLGRRNAA